MATDFFKVAEELRPFNNGFNEQISIPSSFKIRPLSQTETGLIMSTMREYKLCFDSLVQILNIGLS